ncbi:MAG: hypothetical protein BYD32DRAFT_222159 [Podila humilis]|nr:MAG: hypothetical protein BYD32DRAFT_222159 [Podila humilis]
MIIERFIGILCPLASSVVFPNDLHSIQQSITSLALFVALSLSLSRMSFACYCIHLKISNSNAWLGCVRLAFSSSQLHIKDGASGPTK